MAALDRNVILKALAPDELNGLRKAVTDGGDRWGYRFQGRTRTDNSIVTKDGKRYIRWSQIVCGGFLTGLGVEIARISMGEL